MVDQVTAGLQVGLADIARLTGVGPAAVSNWRRRHEAFPRPVGGTERSPRFALTDVEAWLQAQGRTLDLSPQERAWRALDAARDQVDLLDFLVAVGLALLQDGDNGVSLGTGASGDPFRGWRPPPQRVVAGLVAELGDGDGAFAAFEALIDRLLDGAGRPGTSTTPPELAEIMVDLTGPGDGGVFDPACGAGGVLVAAGARGRRPVLGQDLDPSLARLAAVRLAVRGIPSRIAGGDTFHDPVPLPEAPAVVVCHPPFAERAWGQETLTADDRFTFGLPPKGEPELAWVQVALSAAAPGGTTVVVMPPAAASRPSGRRIRRELVARGALAAVISLPPGLATHYALALQLWVLRRTGEGDTDGSGQVVMADVEDAGDGWTSARDLVSDVVSLLYTQPEMAQPELTQPNGPGAAPGSEDAPRIRRVPPLEILDEDVDFTPRRYLTVPAPEVASAAELSRRCDAVSTTWTTLAHAMTEFWATAEFLAQGPDADPESTAIPQLSLDDLVRSGSMAIRRRLSRGGRPATVKAASILTGMDLALRRAPSETGEVDADELRNPPIRSGDVLLPTVATHLRVRVAGTADVGSYPGQSVIVLRPDPAVVDPWYLAGYLSSARAGRQADRVGSSLGGALKIDPRRLRIPVPPIEVQRRWGAVFRRMETTQQLLREAATQGEAVLQEAADTFAVWAAQGAVPAEIHEEQ